MRYRLEDVQMGKDNQLNMITLIINEIMRNWYTWERWERCGESQTNEKNRPPDMVIKPYCGIPSAKLDGSLHYD